MTAVGFEPTRIAPPELESGALDRSAKLSHEKQAFLQAEQKHSRTSECVFCEIQFTERELVGDG